MLVEFAVDFLDPIIAVMHMTKSSLTAVKGNCCEGDGVCSWESGNDLCLNANQLKISVRINADLLLTLLAKTQSLLCQMLFHKLVIIKLHNM